MFKVQVKTNQLWYANKKIITPEQSWVDVLSGDPLSQKAAEVSAAYLEHHAQLYSSSHKGTKVELRILKNDVPVWNKQISN